MFQNRDIYMYNYNKYKMMINKKQEVIWFWKWAK